MKPAIAKKTVVLYPGLAVSHFVPMMQLADALQEQGYSVVVALIDATITEANTAFAAAFAAAVDRVAASKPSVAFHTLPRIQDPPVMTLGVQFLQGYFELIRRYNDRLHDFICSTAHGSAAAAVHAVVVDILSTAAFAVTKKLGIPAFIFSPTSASNLAVFFQFPSILVEGQPSLKELGDAPLNLHGVPPMPASHLTAEMLEAPDSEPCKLLADMPYKNLEADGILVNTFASLEPRAVEALRDPWLLLPGDDSACTMPPVYCVGPLVMGAGGGEAEEEHKCMAWLDEQPERSVVFLCFGSVAEVRHSREQLKEIATGLENSGHRFLWVVRDPAGDDPDLAVLLPEGFLERTRGRGLVVKLWAPQVDVLRHRATGAFVTHCGWNSVLEGVVAGVPMLCWPLYSEQKMSKVFVVEEARVGVEVVGWQRGLVMADEVESKVRLVMEAGEKGAALRAQVAAHRDGAAAAWKDGGSSRAAFAQFLADMEDLRLSRRST